MFSLKCKNRKYCFSLLLVLSICFSAWSQEQKLSLEDARKAALAYSHDIKNGNLRLQQAEASKKAALSNYFPTVQALGTAMYNFNNFISAIPILLPEDIDKVYLATAVATEVVYAGGKVRTGNKLTDIQVYVNTIRADQSIDSVLLNTEQKYWQLVQLQEQQKVVSVSKAYLDELLQQQEDLLAAGLIAKNQLLQVKVKRSELLLQKSKLSNMRKLALLDLALYTGIPFDTLLIASDTIHHVAAPELKYQQPNLNLENNSNYQLLQKSVEASKLQTKMAKSDLYPQIAIGFSATKLGTFHQDLSTDIQPIAFGTVSIPISNWWGSTKQEIKQRELQESIAENNLKNVEDRLKVGIMQSWYNLEDAFKQIEYAQENVAFAEENLKVQRDNYNSGLNNLTDLLDAQRTKQEAATALVTAYANFEIMEMTYLFRTDQLEQ
ncbi:Outer membrane protein TolC [Pustulibacterium marinum]|uniref:Outer membrane protein TolC n=1 Tax=Pustulibacterium marinum TaxID=1224947 RepID=A0A1I7GDI7_9FLAO|nr:TolC family protein [Pustulibacterium marinum]SFU46495.1 Outer membrane protein TolC [Pustulibacterium marinum]